MGGEYGRGSRKEVRLERIPSSGNEKAVDCRARGLVGVCVGDNYRAFIAEALVKDIGDGGKGAGRYRNAEGFTISR